jgi:hypothetical protein
VQPEPQWAESVAELQALSLHWVLPVGHDDEHCPLLQTLLAGQAAQLDPQWSMFDETHSSLHLINPDEQAHTPAWQLFPVGQTYPQMPQFWLSPCTSMHVPLHSI